MRIWDVSPGYLSRQRLLGEHRELHGLVSILVNNTAGYARHPETLRWVGCLRALRRRHALLAAEMAVRGYLDRTPLAYPPGRVRWPRTFITAPGDQFTLLRSKYAAGECGRIALPRTAQTLWAQHKYSVMARDPEMYRTIGRRVSRMTRGAAFADLAIELVAVLHLPPPPARLANAAEHMWGYVSGAATSEERVLASRSSGELLRITVSVARRLPAPYLMASTALSELGVYVTDERP